MLRETGAIIITGHQSPLGLVGYSYRWRGGDVIRISGELLSSAPPGVFRPRDPLPGATFWAGPFQLRCLAAPIWSRDIWACRERPVIARARYLLHRSFAWLDRAYRRTVVCLAVWGLASYEHGHIPSWRDVYALRRLIPVVGRYQRWRFARMLERVNRDLAREKGSPNE